uniref:Uncharacterized protein n=1 Tax=mine drainage metagenome TaxID=410659 RepID=E6Q9S5_9ZZZZ
MLSECRIFCLSGRFPVGNYVGFIFFLEVHHGRSEFLAVIAVSGV